MFNFKRDKKPLSMKSLISREMYISRRKIFVGMRYLTPVAQKMLGEFLAEDTIDKMPYMKKVFECSSFSLALAANAKTWFYNQYGINPAIGIVWTANHAFNFCVMHDYKIRYIEPQTDRQIYPSGKKVFAQI